ncbi:hypothetical protein, partial [Streptomyces sp. NPDC058605]|uniref:hypothetical protein n=1 Tax=Streptomyces sp. NPDC058605 TaxID=3346552 RepID=UPI0036487D32
VGLQGPSVVEPALSAETTTAKGSSTGYIDKTKQQKNFIASTAPVRDARLWQHHVRTQSAQTTLH